MSNKYVYLDTENVAEENLTKTFAELKDEIYASISGIMTGKIDSFEIITYGGKETKRVKKLHKVSIPKKERTIAYIARFSEVAVQEMYKFNIPASIKLGQAILESNAGASELTLEANNHFGIKCNNKVCKKNHCVNYHDDSPKDFFLKFDTAWESFRAHSYVLQKSRYSDCFKLATTDYKGWAKALKKAGYATDKDYANKLIKVIETYELWKYDSLLPNKDILASGIYSVTISDLN